jgi:hypothetical protein
MRGAPRASRPHLPGYGVVPANEGEGLLPWSWAEERLVESRNYWVATCRADGRPHLMAVWGVWHGAEPWFSTGSESVKAKNLARDPAAPSAPTRRRSRHRRGHVERVADPALARVYEIYQAKYYGWSMEGEPFYVLRPRVVFAFIEHADQFASTATRWRFD